VGDRLLTMTTKKTKAQFPGKIKLYADENIRFDIVKVLRMQGINVRHACEVGLVNRDDKTHFQYAKKTGRWLLTTDRGFLDHTLYPFEQVKGIAIVPDTGDDMTAGYILVWLKRELIPSGKNIDNCKVEFTVNNVIFHFKREGEVYTDKVDFI
jgi:uncharacterized protein with PIN domain